MIKKRIVRMFRVITIITFGILIVWSVWSLFSFLSEGQSLLSAQIPYLTLWEILSVGVLGGVGTELILGDCDWPPAELKIRFVLHYIVVNAVVLVCGYLYGWYQLSIFGVFLMCLAFAAVYMLTAYLGYLSNVKAADKMNEKLKAYKERKALEKC